MIFKIKENGIPHDMGRLIEMIGILSVLLLQTINSAVLGLSKDFLVCSAGSVRGSSSSRFGGSTLVLGDRSCLIPS